MKAYEDKMNSVASNWRVSILLDIYISITVLFQRNGQYYDVISIYQISI